MKYLTLDGLKYYTDKINQLKQDVLISGQNIRTINGETLLGEGDIEIRSIVIFNPEGNPAEEYAKLINAVNNGLPVYFGGIENNVLTPAFPCIVSPDNESFIIYANLNIIYGGSPMITGMVYTVDINSISMTDNAQIYLMTNGDGTSFLSNNGQYTTPFYLIDASKDVSTLRSELRDVVNKNIPCFGKYDSTDIEVFFAPCKVYVDISNNNADYKVYSFAFNIGGYTVTEITITTSEVSITDQYIFSPSNYVLKTEAGVAYAEYTGTSTAVAVTTKYGYFPPALVEGIRVSVKFEGNLSYITSLNVNGTGAKSVYYKGSSLTSGMISRYNTYDFVYDGSYWRIIGVNTDTHYTAKNIVGASTSAKANATATNGNVYLNLIENSTVRSKHNIKGTNGIEVTSDASGNITINSTSEANVAAVDASETLEDVDTNTYVKYVAQTLTDEQKAQVRTNIGIEGGGGSDITVDSALSSTSKNPVQNKIILAALNGIADIANSAVQPDDLATVATSGSYNDLSDKPTIPSGTITGVSANGTSVATSGVANIPAASTSKYGVTKLSSSTSSTSTTLAATASAVKAAYDLANSKQATLVSGTNIKTVNGQSLLGSGNITISGGSGSGSYVPMDEIQEEYSNSITVSPNTSVVYQNWNMNADISLTAPTDTTVTNTYTIIMRNYGNSFPITFDKTIIWANDNTPVLDDSASEIIEINIKCINVANADGILYLGTWAKYTK